MTTVPDAREVVARLALAATSGGSEAWLAGAQSLASLDGRSWLLLDQMARSYSLRAERPVSGQRGWLGPSLPEPTGFVAAITSFHVDGRVRQRATRVLAGIDGPVAAAALAVRLLDHVSQVRDEARAALDSRLNDTDAAAVLSVLLAGRRRLHGPDALEWARGALLDRLSAAELFTALARSDDRDVRRWAFSFGAEHGVLSAEQLLSTVRSDPDQWLRASCAAWLFDVATPEEFRALLLERTVDARLVALARLSDAALSDADLCRLLLDPAPRVRELARWRAGRRGIDVAEWYRRQLDASSDAAPREVAASLDGLAAVGSADDLSVFTSRLYDAGVRIRVAALTGVGVHARRDQACALLTPLLEDPSPGVSSAAARVLTRLHAPPSTAATAWSSDQPWSRRAAWRVSRGGGGWDRVEADLRAAGDADDQLASLGLTGIRSWLETSAATTWAVLPDAQRARIEKLLTAEGVDEHLRGRVAFHARVTRSR